ncbi:MAG: YceD family protein [Muribaculaceae bacterium]
MAKFTTFQIPLRGAKQGTDHYEFLLDDDFFQDMESIDIMGGAVKVSLDVRRAEEANYFHFSCQGEISIACNRCLEPMLHEVNAQYSLAVKPGEEYDDSTDGVLIVPANEAELNVAQLVYDTVALTIPIYHVHPEGQCDEQTWQSLQAHTAHILNGDDGDGEQYGTYAHDDEESETNIDPRWAELMKLKDKENNLKNK